LPDRFIGNNDAAFGEQIFYVTEAHTGAMIDKDIADDFRREAVSGEVESGALHEISLSVRRPSGQYRSRNSCFTKNGDPHSDIGFGLSPLTIFLHPSLVLKDMHD
jgi:hypothetical protein